VGVNHRRAHIPVAQQFLNGADVVTVLQKVRRKRVPERVARRLLGKAGLEHSLSDGTLDDRLVQMMAAALTRGSVDVESRRREHPLPGQFTPRVGVLPRERPRQLDPPRALAEVALMERSHSFDMLRQVGLDRARQHRHPVLAALAVVDRDLVHREVDVLDAQPATFQEAKARSVEQERHHAGHAVQTLEDRANFVAREDSGQVLWAFGPDQVIEPWQLDAENLSIEEEQRIEGLVLCGRRDSLANRERRQKGRDFRGAPLAGMALAMEENVALDPVEVRLLGPRAVVACANRVTDAVEELRLRRPGRGGLAKDGRGGRALGGDTVSDRSHRGPRVHRRPPGVPTIARGVRERQARLFWLPRLSVRRCGPILERRAAASGSARGCFEVTLFLRV